MPNLPTKDFANLAPLTPWQSIDDVGKVTALRTFWGTNDLKIDAPFEQRGA